MDSKMYKYLLLFLVPLLFFSCKSTEEFTGFSYDPEGVTNTVDKTIYPQSRRIIGVDSPKVWVSNEFEGARINDFYMINDSTFEVLIAPENAPINNSPWYAFSMWSDAARMADIQFRYNDARHRYIPKISQKDSTGEWIYKEEGVVEMDSTSRMATLSVQLTKDPILISSHPLFTTSGFKASLEERNIIGREFVRTTQAGTSKLGRPIWELEISDVPDNETAPVLVILSRQHPPEVSGYLASLFFLEEITSNSELAKKFRNTFVVKAFPMINPDGVDEGHWRHNAGGIDLNRDWEKFNQPETKVVRDALLPLKEDTTRQVFYGIDFHSTNENIFYPIDEEVETTPDNFTQKWAEQIIEDNPQTEFAIEEFDTSSPISKNWLYKTFGADAITYEVEDEADEAILEEVSRSAARSLMRLLLDEWNQ
ncbi:MAG: M14 family metallopeptidase [Balneolaceae bacterium]